MKIEEILPAASEDQKAFILDHGKVENGKLKYQDDLTSYGWNIKRYNRLKPGAFVLNRHPGKTQQDRKFEIYAGGYVESISEPDSEGNVVAKISHPFKIVPEIKQGDTLIENIKWESKNKKEGSWVYFWNQYGMNEISYNDFKELTKSINCIPINDEITVDDDDLTTTEVSELEAYSSEGFNVIIDENGPTHKVKEKIFKGIARKPNYEKIQKAKSKIGALGEEIVLDLLNKKAGIEGLMKPTHVSKKEGDGLGYDIKTWDNNGDEIHIEVKTTKSNYSDGFEMSWSEVEASKDTTYKYQIYRVYDLNIETKECKIRIFEGPVIEDNFKIIQTQVVVFEK